MSTDLSEPADQLGPPMSTMSWSVEPAKDRSRLGVIAMPESYPATPLPPRVTSSSTKSELRKHCCRTLCVITVVLLTLSIAGTTLGVLSLRGGQLRYQSGQDGHENQLHASTAAQAEEGITMTFTTSRQNVTDGRARGVTAVPKQW